jgi:hypothetical protein
MLRAGVSLPALMKLLGHRTANMTLRFGDMRTEMHQAAFPDDDISDRPEPEAKVPALLHLLDTRPPAGRYRAADLTAAGLR